ncbi:MAG: ornithine carbamoyltransferase, partial [Gemmatimonadota bacterium]
MSIDLKGRSFLTLVDYAPAEIRHLLDLSAELKAAKAEGREVPRLSGL